MSASPRSASSSVYPMIEVSGVRSSWETVAMSSSRSRVAFCSRRLRSVASWMSARITCPLRGPDWGQGDLGGELGAVAAQSEQVLAAHLHGAHRGRVHVARRGAGGG